MADPFRVHGPLAVLEAAFVEEYLRGRGCSRELLARMPRAVANRLLAEAEEEASLLLAQIESRTQYLANLDDGRLK